MLNTPAYDTSAILWRKRATQQLEISAYHYMTPVCLHVHARHIETAKPARVLRLLASKNDATHQNIFYAIQEK